MRKNELAKIQWDQLEFDAGPDHARELQVTKRKAPRTVPILAGDMRDLLHGEPGGAAGEPAACHHGSSASTVFL
jgi:hypothetical protein